MHVLGDFILQPGKWVQHRGVHHFKSRYLYFHAAVHFLLALAVAFHTGSWWMAFAIALGHLVFDGVKAFYRRTDFLAFVIDQSMHVLVILVCCGIFSGINWVAWFSDFALNKKWWWYGLGYLLVVSAYSRFIQFATQEWRKDIPAEREKLLKAGRWIGIMERVLILTFVFSGQLSGVGFLLAAKSIFRFGDLKEPRDKGHTEYVLIGTLMSFGLTFLTGLFILHFAN